MLKTELDAIMDAVVHQMEMAGTPPEKIAELITEATRAATEKLRASPSNKDGAKDELFCNLYVLRVLSDDRIPAPMGPDEMTAIAQQCDDGDYVGTLVCATTTEVHGKTMADLLYAAGSAPTFFMLDDNGDHKD